MKEGELRKRLKEKSFGAKWELAPTIDSADSVQLDDAIKIIEDAQKDFNALLILYAKMAIPLKD